jgi:hypothetical protein
MRTAQGPFPMETTYRFDAVEGGARMRLRNRGEPAGFSTTAAVAYLRGASPQPWAPLQRVIITSERLSVEYLQHTIENNMTRTALQEGGTATVLTFGIEGDRNLADVIVHAGEIVGWDYRHIGRGVGSV